MFQRHPIQNEIPMLVTTNTKKKRPVFSRAPIAQEAVETLYRVQELHPFFLYAFVIMPDHVHLLLRVPEPESISIIMKQFKSGVAFNIGTGPIWQSRFHIRNVENPAGAKDYIHSNPLKAGLVEAIDEYLWSSANRRWPISDLPW